MSDPTRPIPTRLQDCFWEGLSARGIYNSYLYPKMSTEQKAFVVPGLNSTHPRLAIAPSELVLFWGLHKYLRFECESYRVGPKNSSWPNILTVNPYLQPQVGPTFGPTL